jgi:hypothetical protein
MERRRRGEATPRGSHCVTRQVGGGGGAGEGGGGGRQGMVEVGGGGGAGEGGGGGRQGMVAARVTRGDQGGDVRGVHPTRWIVTHTSHATCSTSISCGSTISSV